MVFQRAAAAPARCRTNALNLAGFNEDTAENILENRRRFLKLFPSEQRNGRWRAAGKFTAPTCV